MVTRGTYLAKPGEVERLWVVVDADGQVLGRMATHIARLLMGKHRPTFTPSTDTGDFVIVVNAEKVRLTGNKPDQKYYFRHSGYPGGAKMVPYDRMLRDHPDRIITSAVKGMLPKSRLGDRFLHKLKVYAGPEHPHAAQLAGQAAGRMAEPVEAVV